MTQRDKDYVDYIIIAYHRLDGEYNIDKIKSKLKEEGIEMDEKSLEKRVEKIKK
jgi:hypothetical protein